MTLLDWYNPLSILSAPSNVAQRKSELSGVSGRVPATLLLAENLHTEPK